MFIYTPLLFFLSALSTTAMGDPEIYSAQITPAPTTLESLVLRDTTEATTTTYRDPPDIFSVQPTPFPSFCCSYNTTKVSDSLVNGSYVLNLNGFGNTDSSPAHSSKSTDLECVPSLKNAIDEIFMSEGGYEKSLWCYPSYGGINDTYVVIEITAHPEDQGAALLEVLRKWAPGWAAPSVAAVPGSEPTQWMDPRTLIPDDATCQKGGSCSSQQVRFYYSFP
ncbi:uncharacterized protein EAF02_004010 [Botrytis sinoallii]|uniref:uncharacterized protein n=1 Tax=Botrytis sinoallii TaxID=1463999 RepID=UPI0019007641|nr:uncharacterized protein EAF02_004010 [Botrytis sinoallii]KAF7885501.1 hypothetical protein EAF02_004010 [Botrytis sinoallii]